MQCQSYAFSSHAIKRMFERGLSRDEVVTAIEQGQVIKDYPADQPYPMCLQRPFGKQVLRRKKRELRHLQTR